MKAARRDAARLQDMLDAIASIERHPLTDRVVFDEDELLRFFVLKHVEILGEAIFKISDDQACVCLYRPNFHRNVKSIGFTIKGQLSVAHFVLEYWEDGR